MEAQAESRHSGGGSSLACSVSVGGGRATMRLRFVREKDKLVVL